MNIWHNHYPSYCLLNILQFFHICHRQGNVLLRSLPQPAAQVRRVRSENSLQSLISSGSESVTEKSLNQSQLSTSLTEGGEPFLSKKGWLVGSTWSVSSPLGWPRLSFSFSCAQYTFFPSHRAFTYVDPL